MINVKLQFEHLFTFCTSFTIVATIFEATKADASRSQRKSCCMVDYIIVNLYNYDMETQPTPLSYIFVRVYACLCTLKTMIFLLVY